MAEHTPQPLMGDLALAADRAAEQHPTAQDATATGDAASDASRARRADRPSDATTDGRRDDDDRRDPSPDAVPGADDAGAQGRDRDNGGWGDSGLFGGRAGGTGP